MSKFEIFLIVCAVLVPFIAMVFVLPKHKKKEKPAKPLKTLADIKKEEQRVEPEFSKVQPQKEIETDFEKEVNNLDVFEDTGFSSADFKDYLSKRKVNSRPEFVKTPEEDTTFSYADFLEKRKAEQNKQPKTIKEEIHSLSPELKAMLVAGVLDKKNFD